jgi:hypothetical protein
VIRRNLLSRNPENDNRKDIHIELETADHEEPTWEVRPAGQSRRRLDRRTRTILGVAVAAAIVVNVGAAWAYWHVTRSPATIQAAAGTAVELTLHARNDLNSALVPGRTGNLTVTVANQYDFPIRIRQVTPGGGKIVADEEHLAAGCTSPGVSFTQRQYAVSWDVPRNTVGAFTIPDGLAMSRTTRPACRGATYTVPVTVTGYSIDKG